jgi:hypothetical protein
MLVMVPTMDEGPPSSYLLLASDTPVYCSDGIVAGRVKEVLREERNDIFDGLVLASDYGDRFVPADRVAAIHERGVDLSLPSADVVELTAPAPHRRIKFDVSDDERPWIEVLHWLCEHLAHLVHPGDPRLERAREHLAQRERALKLARENPRLAIEAGVGRPDVPDAYHGWVVDLNHAPAEVIASLPGVDIALARRLVVVREEVDGFSSLEDLGTLLDMPGSAVDRLRDHVVVLPR